MYILDDPLSAVDTVVGKRLFQTCMSGVLKNSIVVLVTHHLQYAQLADSMLVIDQVCAIHLSMKDTFGPQAKTVIHTYICTCFSLQLQYLSYKILDY